MDWIEVLRSFGFPVVCVIAMSLALWRVATWVASNLVKPAVEAHIVLITQLRASLTAHDIALQSQSQALEAQGHTLSQIAKTLAISTVQQTKVATMLTDSDKKGPAGT